MPRVLSRALLLLVLCLAVSPSHAGQSVLGKLFLVKDPQPGIDPSLRRLVAVGKEVAPGDGDTIVGDPTVLDSTGGAFVQFVANGGMLGTQVQTFPLPAAGWKRMPTNLSKPLVGYTYKDPKPGSYGAVRSAVIKTIAGGGFLVKVVAVGSSGPGPQPHVTIVPPNPGTSGSATLTINNGETYCIAFGDAAGGRVLQKPSTPPHTKGLRIASTIDEPTVETVCAGGPVPTTTTTTTPGTTTTTFTGTTTSSTTTTTTTTSTTTTSTSTTTTSTTSTTTTTIICAIQITDTPSGWLPQGRAYGSASGDPGNSVDFVATVTTGAPRKVQILLDKTNAPSSEPGVAMNYGDEAATSPDLKLIQTASVNPAVGGWGAPNGTGMRITTTGPVAAATVTVTSYDWGAWGEITACCFNPAGTSCETYSTTKRIPRDSLPPAGNHVADAFFAGHASEAGNWDGDATPSGMKRDGDGFSFYEEYRGAMHGFTGSHSRLDPEVKELFIYDEDRLHVDSHTGHRYTSLTGIGIYYVNADPAVLMTGTGTAAAGKRKVNHRSSNAKLADQYALHVKKATLSGRASWGLTDGADVGPPKTADPLVKVDAAQIATDFSAAVTAQGGNPAGAEQAVYEDVRDRQTAATTTHEMGHGTGLVPGTTHHAAGGRASPYGNTYSGEVQCVMRYAFDLIDSSDRVGSRDGADVDNMGANTLTDAAADFVTWGVTAGVDKVVIDDGTGAMTGTFNITAVAATTLTLAADPGDSGGAGDVEYYVVSNKPTMWGVRTADKSPATTEPPRFRFSNYTDKTLSDFIPLRNVFCTANQDCRGKIDVKDD